MTNDNSTVTVRNFSLRLWHKFVGTAKMRGLSVAQALGEAIRQWLK